MSSALPTPSTETQDLSDDSFNYPCDYNNTSKWINEKFFLVVVGGNTVAVISIVENLLLLYILLSRPHFRSSNLFFLTILAFLDILVSVAYIFLMTVQVLFDYLDSPSLSAAWHAYLRPFFTLSKVSIDASTFLILAATLERFISIAKLGRLSQKNRIQFAAAGILFGVVMKASVFFEIQVHTMEHCEGLARYAADLSDLAHNSTLLRVGWMFYVRNIVTTFCPFAALFVLNILIVYHMWKQQKAEDSSARSNCVRKDLLRATRMLILVVTFYLLTNVPNVFITVWENFDKQQLQKEYDQLYALSTDVISILSVLSTASRLPIYLWCNPLIKKEFRILIAHCLLFNHDPETGQFRHKLSVSGLRPYSTTAETDPAECADLIRQSKSSPLRHTPAPKLPVQELL